MSLPIRKVNRMTDEEAIKILNAAKLMTEGISDLSEACKIAISALEKQIPKKPKAIDWERFEDKVDNAIFMRGGFWCPNCGHFIKSGSYCCDCGQAIDWSEDESSGTV